MLRRALTTVVVLIAAGLAVPGVAAAAPVTVKRVDSTVTVTPDSGGRATIPYCPAADPCAFPRVPDAVVVTGRSPQSATLPVNLIAYNSTTTGFTLRALNQTGAPITTQIQVSYHASLSGAAPGQEGRTVNVTTDASGYANVSWAQAQTAAPVSVVASGVNPTQAANIPVSMLIVSTTATTLRVRALEQNGAPIAGAAIRVAYLASWQPRSQPTNTGIHVDGKVTATTDSSGHTAVNFAQALPVAPTGIQVTGAGPTAGGGIPASLVAYNPTTTGFQVRALEGDGAAIASKAVTIYYHAATGTRDADVVPSRIPLEDFSRTSGMQASPAAGGSLGTVEYAYSDNIGRLLHGHQTSPDDFGSVQWTPIHDLEAFAGTPGMVEQADGRLQVVAHNVTGNIWVRPQATKQPPAFDGWVNLGGLMASHPAVARQTDGSVAMFAVDAAGTLWALQQTGANGAYGFWFNLGMTGLNPAGTPVAVSVNNGIRIFVRDTAGALRTALYAGRALSGAASLGGSGLTGSPAAVVYPGGRVRVFARAADGSIVTQQQDTGGTFPGVWDTVGTFTAAGSPSALLSPANGKAEVVARAADGVVYSTGETVQGSGVWRDWVKTKNDSDPFVAATDPTALSVTNANGQTWGFVVRDMDNANRVYTVGGFASLADGAESLTFVPRTLPAPPR
jgi:hypothetical protein